MGIHRSAKLVQEPTGLLTHNHLQLEIGHVLGYCDFIFAGANLKKPFGNILFFTN
jgi:hypothetical protein